MINEFYHELTCGATGTDCPATLAWLTAKLDGDSQYAAAQRAAAYWAAADETVRSAIAEWLGWLDCPVAERAPVPRAIAQDFKDAERFAEELLNGD
jgi:hypothetical protein